MPKCPNDIEREARAQEVSSIEFMIGGFFNGYTTYRLVVRANGANLAKTHEGGETLDKVTVKTQYSVQEANARRESFAAIHVERWNEKYYDPDILDGTQWNLTVHYADGSKRKHSGSNAFPENFEELLGLFEINAGKGGAMST